MTVKIIHQPITLAELRILAREGFGDMVKAVVDLEKKVIAIGGELHADEEALLIEHGSKQQNLWGVNIYPDQAGEGRIEFDSMINIRPSQGNRSRNVEQQSVREDILRVINVFVIED